MAIEYRLSHTASEIDKKLTAVGEIENSLKNNYYTSTDIDTKIEEVNTSIGEVNTTLEEINTSLEEVNTSLTTKADLVDGKVSLDQLPDDIGGGLTEADWETNVINKPFYDTRVRSYYSQVENPNPVSFHNQMMNYSFYKISDLTPTREQIFGELKVLVDGSEITLAENAIIMELDGCLAVGTNYTFFFTEVDGTINFTFSGYPMTLEVPESETGIYAILPLNSGVPTNRTYEFICGGELKQIDPKFIPADLDFNLDDYYTKSEIDGLFNQFDQSLASAIGSGVLS